MSIQASLSPKNKRSRLYRSIISRYGLLADNISRCVSSYIDRDCPRVYFQLRNRYTHPFIRERMYGKNAPVRWSTYNGSMIRHSLQFDRGYAHDKKKVLIEPNDNGWTILQTFGWSARDGLPESALVARAYDYICSQRVHGILVADDGVRKQLFDLFGSSISNKLLDYRMMRTIPTSPWEVARRIEDLRNGSRQPCFIAICSDFGLKCGPEIIEAWRRRETESGYLTVVVPPTDMEEAKEQARSTKGIEIICGAPLGRNQLARLLRTNDVSLCLTYSDGGATAFEAIEHGHAVITNDYHRGEYLTQLGNGVVIEAPLHFYSQGGYGVKWHDLDSYKPYIEKINWKNRVEYIDSLSATFDYLANDIEQLSKMSWLSWELACKESVVLSNLDLQRYYSDACI